MLRVEGGRTAGGGRDGRTPGRVEAPAHSSRPRRKDDFSNLFRPLTLPWVLGIIAPLPRVFAVPEAGRSDSRILARVL